MFYLGEPIRALWAKRDPFESALALQGEVYRDLDSRRTLRFVVAGRSYFAKVHSGVGWREIFKNLLQLKWPTISARSEWRAIQRLHELGIDTMALVAYGERGWNPARIQSFVVTEALENVESLEYLFKEPLHWALAPRERLTLVRQIADLTRRMHGHGINHRDYYLCHLLLARDSLAAARPRLYVIDLHRAQIRRATPRRARIKDVSALFYSAIGEGLRRNDVLRFMTRYSGLRLRETLARDASFWRRVYRRAVKMYLEDGTPLPDWLVRLGR